MQSHRESLGKTFGPSSRRPGDVAATTRRSKVRQFSYSHSPQNPPILPNISAIVNGSASVMIFQESNCCLSSRDRRAYGFVMLGSTCVVDARLTNDKRRRRFWTMTTTTNSSISSNNNLSTANNVLKDSRGYQLQAREAYLILVYTEVCRLCLVRFNVISVVFVLVCKSNSLTHTQATQAREARTQIQHGVSRRDLAACLGEPVL